MHINCLELLGGAFVVKIFAKQRQNLHIRLQMNSTTAVAYINRMGGTHSSTLSNMACSLWQWCLQRGITLSAEHLPGIHNITADAESRTFHSSAEWQLLPSVFRGINTTRSLPGGPLCYQAKSSASMLHQLVSRPFLHEHRCLSGKMDWLPGVSFPSICSGGKVPPKSEEREKLTINSSPSMVITSLVPSPSPVFGQKPSANTNVQQHTPGSFRSPTPNGDPRAAPVSRMEGLRKNQEFRKGLPSLYCQDGAKEQHHPTSQAGKNGGAGVIEGKLILFNAI